MGKYGITEEDIDKWSFYKFSQRCDEMVDVVIDGVSTTERRHMCNLYVENSADAYQFISGLLKIYSASLSWSSGKLAIVQDAPATEGPVMMFTNTNVSEEGFSYSSTPQSNRYTACTVAYVDERDNYRPKVEYVEDISGIKKYGYKKLEIAGIGVTRKGEAHRLAWQNILSFQMETEVIQFGAGLEASYLRPGDVIQIVDNHKIEKRSGGRISKIKNSNTIEIDMPVSILPAAGSYLILEKPTSSDDPSDIVDSSNIADRRSPQYLEYEIQSKTGFEVVFTSNLDSSIFAGYNWIIKENSSDKIKPKYYKIESMSETSSLSFSIQASEYFDEKYEYVDASTSNRNGINITERDYYGHSIDTSALGGLTI
jgi:predicted phage tail protein